MKIPLESVEIKTKKWYKNPKIWIILIILLFILIIIILTTVLFLKKSRKSIILIEKIVKNDIFFSR